jgi:hypothetical protein
MQARVLQKMFWERRMGKVITRMGMRKKLRMRCKMQRA